VEAAVTPSVLHALFSYCATSEEATTAAAVACQGSDSATPEPAWHARGGLMLGMAASAQASATRATIFGMEIPPSMGSAFCRLAGRYGSISHRHVAMAG
jgi:hypothetical protein